MITVHIRWLLATLALAVASAALPATAAAESYTKQTLHFLVHVGPGDATTCNVVADLYRPAGATAAHPDPAILTTNGFGGSKDDQAAMAGQFASRGYVVLSYSGLGFGGSGCPIELDDPDWDGKAASQLITFLGGGMAAADGTTVDYVTHDFTGHDGVHYAFDPRVGMIGGSYGGEVQFAAAEQDPRIDTIVPIITWNDLSYSLAPNNANLPSGSVTNTTPGVAKAIWALFFFGEGAAVNGLQQLATDPMATLSSCPNFNSQVCPQAIALAATGAPSPEALAFFRHASVASYMAKIRIPTLLAQGENDTLFELHEAVATYDALRAQHTPVKMIWQSWGHSHLAPAPGEFGDFGGSSTYEGTTVLQWFNHYLKGDPAAPSLDFTFFCPWATYAGNADQAYGRSPTYPVGAVENLELSSAGSLVPAGATVSDGATTFLTTAAGAPTSYSEISAVETNLEPGLPPLDVPGSYAEYETAPLARNTDVVGIPTVQVRVSAPVQSAAQSLGPLADLVLFFKLYDISPSGSVTLPDKLIAPVRIPITGGAVRVSVDLPGIVHRFPVGDRIALVIAGGDLAYRGNVVPGTVTVTTSAGDPGVLQLPVATPGAYGPVVYAEVPPTTRVNAPALDTTGSVFAVRWKGTPNVVSYTVQERDRRHAYRWRTLGGYGATARRSVRFRARDGETYEFRARATNLAGGLGPWGTARTVALTGVHIAGGRYRGPWRVALTRGAYDGRTVGCSSPACSFTLAYDGGTLQIVGDLSPAGGRARITLDGRSRTIGLHAARTRRRMVIYTSKLRPGRHRLTIRVLAGTVTLEGLGIASRLR
jgi:predicted acyl esterase